MRDSDCSTGSSTLGSGAGGCSGLKSLLQRLPQPPGGIPSRRNSDAPAFWRACSRSSSSSLAPSHPRAPTSRRRPPWGRNLHQRQHLRLLPHQCPRPRPCPRQHPLPRPRPRPRPRLSRDLRRPPVQTLEGSAGGPSTGSRRTWYRSTTGFVWTCPGWASRGTWGVTQRSMCTWMGPSAAPIALCCTLWA